MTQTIVLTKVRTAETREKYASFMILRHYVLSKGLEGEKWLSQVNGKHESVCGVVLISKDMLKAYRTLTSGISVYSNILELAEKVMSSRSITDDLKIQLRIGPYICAIALPV